MVCYATLRGRARSVANLLTSANNPVDPVDATTKARDVIRIEDLHKYYVMGKARVHVLRGVSVLS